MTDLITRLEQAEAGSRDIKRCPGCETMFHRPATEPFWQWKKRHYCTRNCGLKAAVAESLYKRALGYSHPDVHISNFQGMITVTDIVKHYPPDTGAAFIWLKNRQPHKWKDKVEVKEDINLNIFPPKEVLKELFEASLKRSTEKAAMLTNRRERLGIVIEAGQDVD